MASGCPIIIRPSEMTPISAYAVGMLCEKIKLPDGVVQILCTNSHEVADALTSSKIPQVITLIGSTQTGQHEGKSDFLPHLQSRPFLAELPLENIEISLFRKFPEVILMT